MPFRLIQTKVEEILSLDGNIIQLEKSLKKSLYDLKHLNTIRLGKREIKSKVSIIIDELEKSINKDELDIQLNWFKLLYSKIDEYRIFWNTCSEEYLIDLSNKLKVILDEHGIEIGVKHRGVNFIGDQSFGYLGNRFCFYIRNNHSSIFYYLRQMIESMEEHEKKEYLVDIIDELKVLEQKLIETKDLDRTIIKDTNPKAVEDNRLITMEDVDQEIEINLSKRIESTIRLTLLQLGFDENDYKSWFILNVDLKKTEGTYIIYLIPNENIKVYIDFLCFGENGLEYQIENWVNEIKTNVGSRLIKKIVYPSSVFQALKFEDVHIPYNEGFLDDGITKFVVHSANIFKLEKQLTLK